MLSLPPFAFANCSDNLATGTPSNSPGTAFTAGASNADGAAVSVLAALAHDVHWLAIGLGGITVAAADGQCLLDLLSDPAGGTSWGSLIDDLICGFTPGVAAASAVPVWYYFPLWIPAGTSLGVRARTAHTANITSGQAIVVAYGNPSRPDTWWCGQKVESLGINAASSKGTDVTPGSASAYGAWTSVGAATGGRYGFLQFGINGSDADTANLAYHWEIGYGSTKLPGSPTMRHGQSAAEVGARDCLLPLWCDIAQGTQMQARAKCSGTAEVINVGLYGVH